MELLRKTNGITIIEILIASLLASVVFLAVASSYTSGLRLLALTRDAASLDPAMAMNAMSKNIALANQIVIDPSYKQLTLRLDYINDGTGVPTTPRYTADTSDDFYVMYRFISGGLRTAYGLSARNINGTDPEVIPGLSVTDGSFSLFNLSPVAVTVSIQSGGRTLITTAAVRAGAAS